MSLCCWYVVISPELVLEVEARMRRNYLPTSLLPQRKHSHRHAVKPHLPTVQELQGNTARFANNNNNIAPIITTTNMIINSESSDRSRESKKQREVQPRPPRERWLARLIRSSNPQPEARDAYGSTRIPTAPTWPYPTQSTARERRFEKHSRLTDSSSDVEHDR